MRLDDRVTIATPEGVALELVLAGLGSRFLARLLDTVIQVAHHHRAVARRRRSQRRPASCGRSSSSLIFLVMFAYDVPFEVLNHGRTIGKMAAGIRVVGAQRRAGPLPRRARSATSCASSTSCPSLYLVGVDLDRRDRSATNASATSRRGTVVVRDQFPGLRTRTARAAHRAARRGRDVGRLRGRRRRGRDDPSVPRPPARAAVARAQLLRHRARGSASGRRSRARRTARIPSTCSKASSSRSRHADDRSRAVDRRRIASCASRPAGLIGDRRRVADRCRCTRRSRARCARPPASRARSAA